MDCKECLLLTKLGNITEKDIAKAIAELLYQKCQEAKPNRWGLYSSIIPPRMADVELDQQYILSSFQYRMAQWQRSIC